MLENLPQLWKEADLGERRRILMTMLDAVYVDTVELKSIVAIKPKPAFVPLFESAITREESDVFLIKEPSPGSDPEADSCFWWRRGRDGLSLKHGLVVWVIDDWPTMLAVYDTRSWDSSLSHPVPAGEECLDLVAA